MSPSTSAILPRGDGAGTLAPVAAAIWGSYVRARRALARWGGFLDAPSRDAGPRALAVQYSIR